MNSQVTKTTRQWTAAAAGIALALSAVPHAAYAGAKAFAHFSYEDFLFTDLTNGGVLELINDVAITSFTSSTTHSVNRLFGPGAGSDAEATADNNAANGVLVDTTFACVGAAGPTGCAGVVENDFTMGDFLTDEYHRADSRVQGSGLDISAAVDTDPGTPGIQPLPPGTAINTGFLDLIAESITQAGANDTGNSTFTNTTEFTIVPMAGIAIQLDFTAIRDIFTDLHPDAAQGSSASGGVTFTVSLQQGNTQIALGGVPNLNVNRASTNPAAGPNTFNSTDAVSITTPVLMAGVAYTFQLDFSSNVQVLATKDMMVPEPSALGLIGLGLMGVALGARRRRKA